MSALPPTPSPTHAEIRTPLGRVRGLGSAKSGSEHFFKQRVSAVANLVLVPLSLYLLLKLSGSSHAELKTAFGNPAVSLVFLLLVMSALYHMRLGMQVIIEDYVRSEGRKLLALMLNSFFSVVVGAISVFSILKLALGA